jgi:hypothetical protein
MRAFDVYMQFVEHALEAADHADDEQRIGWIKLSESWLRLATEEALSPEGEVFEAEFYG